MIDDSNRNFSLSLTFVEVSDLYVRQEVNNVHEELFAVPMNKKVREKPRYHWYALLQIFLKQVSTA